MDVTTLIHGTQSGEEILHDTLGAVGLQKIDVEVSKEGKAQVASERVEKVKALVSKSPTVATAKRKKKSKLPKKKE